MKVKRLAFWLFSPISTDFLASPVSTNKNNVWFVYKFKICTQIFSSLVSFIYFKVLEKKNRISKINYYN